MALAVALAVACLGLDSAHAERPHTPVTWTKCVEHLSWPAARHVVHRHCTEYSMPKEHRAPTSWSDTSRQLSPHVRVLVHFPQFQLPNAVTAPVGTSVLRWGVTITAAAKAYQLDPNVIAALIYTESRGDPMVTSGDDARGLTQMLDSTSAQMGVSNPYDPTQSIYGGCRYLRYLMGYYRVSLYGALAYYYGGPSYAYAAQVWALAYSG